MNKDRVVLASASIRGKNVNLKKFGPSVWNKKHYILFTFKVQKLAVLLQITQIGLAERPVILQEPV